MEHLALVGTTVFDISSREFFMVDVNKAGDIMLLSWDTNTVLTPDLAKSNFQPAILFHQD